MFLQTSLTMTEIMTDEKYECEVCKCLTTKELPMFCQTCVDKYGNTMLKAVVDPFCYAFGLKSGMVLWVETIAINKDWVYFPKPESDFSTKLTFPFERGLQVRLDEIAWVADAPRGS